MSDIADTVSSSSAINGNSSETSTPIATTTVQVTVADYLAFIQYLKQFVPVLLDADYSSVAEFDKCLNERLNVECIKKFMSDAQVRSLVIQKNLTKGD